MGVAIQIRGLKKSYGSNEAVRGIDLSVNEGQVFAFLGPNGAGKTTTVEILEGYRERTEGDVEVLGVDPRDGDQRWRERIGIVLQECRMEPLLSVRETLDLYAGYYEAPRDVDETIALVGLEGKADARAGKLSGGQQRRLDVALALVGDAELLFLDEPTTGFDPSARRQAWEVIASLRELGKTVFLTTHYMDEAQFLADRVAIIRDGRIVAEGAPNELGGRAERASTIRFLLPPGVSVDDLPRGVGRVESELRGAGVAVSTSDPVATLNSLTGWALERGVGLSGLEVTRPTLEEMYLELTEDVLASPSGARPSHEGDPQ
ncbi:MAG: ABC transporter ATP-binding protein [Actinomycetota bacterium]|nr:ABC transporter ATP-binding protein [Actinomycetota bacterium]